MNLFVEAWSGSSLVVRSFVSSPSDRVHRKRKERSDQESNPGLPNHEGCSNAASLLEESSTPTGSPEVHLKFLI